MVLWSRDAGGTIVQAPVLAGERLYVALDDGRLASLRIQNGTPVWERRLGGAPQPMLVTGDRLYVGAADNYFYCVRTVDGAILWRWRTGADIVGAAVHDGGRVYFASMDNVLRALDAGSGAQRWKKALPLRPTSGPIRVNDVVLLTGLGTSVLGFQLKDGAAAGEFDAGGLLAAPPHPVSGPLLAAPLLVSITRSVASGSRIVAITRDFEPPARPLVPLPNEAPMEQLPEGVAPPATPTDDDAAEPAEPPAPPPAPSAADR